jgi:hypothetical protein
LRHRRQADENVGAQADREQDRGSQHGLLTGNRSVVIAPCDHATAEPSPSKCGTGATPTDVGQRFTDTFAYKDLKLTFTFSCYLIKHGDEYMVWDTGFAPGTNPNAPKVGIVDRLKELKVTPEQVK